MVFNRMDAFRSHTQKSPADCSHRWEVFKIFQKNFSLEQVCAPPLSLLDKRTYRPCKNNNNNNNGRTEALYILYNVYMVRLLNRILLFHSPTGTLYYTHRHSIYTSGPTIIITIRRARRIIIILYTRSVMLRLAAAAAASIPLAVPTPKCLGRNNIYETRNLVAPGPDYIIQNNIILYCMRHGRRGLSVVGLFFGEIFFSHRLPSTLPFWR